MENQNQSQQRPTVVVSKKSMGVSILLTILFGPLGMFYSTVSGAIIMLIISVIIAIFTAGIGILITWPVCIIWGAMSTSSYNQKLTQY